MEVQSTLTVYQKQYLSIYATLCEDHLLMVQWLNCEVIKHIILMVMTHDISMDNNPLDCQTFMIRKLQTINTYECRLLTIVILHDVYMSGSLIKLPGLLIVIKHLGHRSASPSDYGDSINRSNMRILVFSKKFNQFMQYSEIVDDKWSWISSLN